MKLWLALVFSLVVLVPLDAQITITATGTVSGLGLGTPVYLDSSVQLGDTFVETFTFQSNGQGGFNWGGGTSTVSVGDYSLVSDNNLGLQSALVATYTNGSGPFGLSGYVFTSTVFTPHGLGQADFFLETTDPGVASLITTNTIPQLPLSDFNYDTGQDLNFIQLSDTNIQGNLTSYSVEIAVPEPSTLLLFVVSALGLAVVAGLRRQLRVHFNDRK